MKQPVDKGLAVHAQSVHAQPRQPGPRTERKNFEGATLAKSGQPFLQSRQSAGNLGQERNLALTAMKGLHQRRGRHSLQRLAGQFMRIFLIVAHETKVEGGPQGGRGPCIACSLAPRVLSAEQCRTRPRKPPK
eukprot:6806711-Pyramimonas_sp.AAC.1